MFRKFKILAQPRQYSERRVRTQSVRVASGERRPHHSFYIIHRQAIHRHVELSHFRPINSHRHQPPQPSIMPSSLTPESRSTEATEAAAYEGLFNGVLTLLPTMGIVGWALQKYPSFASRTNWQSRTAITIMPAMFVAALSSELKLSHKMKEIAQEQQHAVDTVHWGEEQWKLQKHDTKLSERQHVTALYQQSVRSGNVCVVPELQWYHKAANFTSQNPLKVLATAAVPAYVFIFRGRAEQGLAVKIMHTRVLGQAAAIGMLLGVMGFKDWMDANGRFISEAQANDRVQEMQVVREEVLQRMEEDQQRKADLRAALKAEQGDGMRDGKKKKTKKQERALKKGESSATTVQALADELTTDASTTNPMATAANEH